MISDLRRRAGRGIRIRNFLFWFYVNGLKCFILGLSRSCCILF